MASKIGEAKQDGDSTKKAVMVLVWPSHLKLPSSSASSRDGPQGFAIGWSSTSSTATTIVVAGVVWIPSTSQTAIEKEVKTWEQRIDTSKKRHTRDCYCSCNPAMYSPWGTLQIVARMGSKNNGNKISRKLPCIVWNHENVYPIITLHPQQQILLYDQDKLYQHDIGPADSSFGLMLSKASLAAAVMKELHSENEVDRTATIKNVASESAQRLEQNSSPILSQFSFWIRNSMLLQHLFTKTRHLSTLLFEQQLFHWIPLLNLWNIWRRDRRNRRCQKCQKPTWNNHNMPPTEWTNYWMKNVVNLLTGFLLGLILLQYWEPIKSLCTFYFVKQSFLQDRLNWLESFPIGFKLNVPLTRSIGHEVRALMILRQQLLDGVSNKIESWMRSSLFILCKHSPSDWLPGILLLTITTLAGGSTCLALAMDLVSIMTMHLSLISQAARFVYRTELYLLGSMWRLFRGKKLNVLRHRTDSMEYDAMQLLLGSLLFVTSLFMLTTILVYYTFFTVLQLTVQTLPTVGLGVTYLLVEDFPLGTVYLRVRKPGGFVSRVILREMPLPASSANGTNNQMKSHVLALEAVPESLGSILSSNHALTRSTRALKSFLVTTVSESLSGKAASSTLMLG